jgi:AraC family transcriptional regulator
MSSPPRRDPTPTDATSRNRPETDVASRTPPAPSTVLFASDLVRVGRFRCPISHPRFNDSGPTQTFCFVFPRTSVWIEHEGRAPFVADANVIPLYNRARPYERRAISPDGDRTDWFGVAPALLREVLAEHDPLAANDPDTLFRFGFGPATPRIYAWQRALFTSVATSQRPSALFIEESVVELLAQVLARLYRSRTGAQQRAPVRLQHRGIVEDARAHLSATYARDENLGQMAAAVGVSVFHLCRLFRRLTGGTLHRYRNQLRLHSALERLEDGRGDILGVATELGYSGHSHFTAAFRAAFGVCPSQWRAAAAQLRLDATAEARATEVMRGAAPFGAAPPSLRR